MCAAAARAGAAAACLAFVAAGCAVGGGRDVVRQTPSATDGHRHSPHARTVVRSGRLIPVGRAAEIAAQRGAALRVLASRPSVSRTRLASDHGYPPAHGYYVTFHVTITDTGRTPLLVGPHDFRVRVPGEGTVTSYDGNAAYSGAARQLDTTQLEPRQRVRAPLTFDVRSPHGRLVYAPDGSAAVTWTY